MTVVIRRPRTRQPQGGVRVDRGHPIARSIACVFMPGSVGEENTIRDLISNWSASALAGTFSYRRNAGLIGASRENIYSFTPTKQFIFENSQTVVVLSDVTAAATVKPFVSQRPSGGGAQIMFAANMNTSFGASSGTVTMSNAVGVSLTAASAVATTGRPTMYGYSLTSSSAGQIYVEGRPVSTAVSGSGWTLAASPNWNIGYHEGLGALHSGAGIYLLAAWNRALTEAEHLALAQNPWQLFAPIERRIWVPSAGAGGTTVSVPAGSLILTGNAPTILTPRTIAVPKGELTLTGNAPTVSTPIVVAVPVGSLSLTGFAPTVVTPRTIPVPAGTLSLTGFAPTVTTGGGQTIQVPAGSIVLTGYAPVVVAPRTISVPAGSLTITGYAPTVLTSTVISVPAGSLTLTGFAPSVVATANKYISVPSGTLTLTGYAPTVSSGSLTIYFWKRTA